MEYMSQEGYDKIVAELNDLIKVQLPKIKDELIEAREKGDLSENFEYHAAKRAHGKLLGRIRFLQRVLEFTRVLDTSNRDVEKIGLLSRVELTNLANNMKMTYTIASIHEADMRAGKISEKSPIAQALMGKRAGDIVEVQVPMGKLRLKIEKVSLD